ncbi:carboxylating nicotinate-nucleotide diphosphorylase [Marinobacterium lutimaris]|uniref:Probable nicotinate-nucleotide pyrophosphorylase [carboxylating] n=1 Tax=Marinobacterium lutimaris TaxID=568106 RepID=A0A1H6C4W1_9GAMM|nr:carboxylating nicotinate-nucleotide diphosphorylase [Marinobacterium lutimaris]SEG67675.1 nicotinate-nucleotide pyrophosphorylase [carboxylating] [Marinobacterium lutimaris]
MYPIDTAQLRTATSENVVAALAEDVGSGDINAALIGTDSHAHARIITRQEAVFCGRDWADEVFRQLDPSVQLEWAVSDGDKVQPNATLVTLQGPARSLLTGERAVLNFLQLLSGTATRTGWFVKQVEGTGVQLLDTRKTLPGLRLAQKYAVRCGGGQNHRMGLYDAFLIKENHIAACGGLAEAVEAAHRSAPGKLVEVETETLEELDQALDAGADVIMLDNFSLSDTQAAVEKSRGRAKIEASGGINNETLIAIARTGVDFISMGTLTKDVSAIDLSMRLSVID